MWESSEEAVLRATRVDWERAVDKEMTLKMELVTKIILDERFTPETKAQATNWASKVFKHDAEYRKLDRGTENFLSGDGPLLNIRSDHAGSRQRTCTFMRVASTYFHQTMGQWHDDWVTDLTNVVFPDHTTTVDAVRSPPPLRTSLSPPTVRWCTRFGFLKRARHRDLRRLWDKTAV